MEQLEPIEVLNKRLKEHFGTEWNGWSIYRIVWSEDQLEKRLMEYTDSGVLLLAPEVREVPKYRQWVTEKYVLEKLSIVPEEQIKELADNKISYEPLWVFMDKDGFTIPPKWEAAKFVIDCVNAAKGEYSLGPKYVDPEIDQPVEKTAQRINDLQDELFGNETNTGDALAHGQAIVVPSSYEKREN